MYCNREARSLLLGSRYSLLPRFRFWRTFEIAPRARRVLITMGGSDPDNVTEQFLRMLLPEPDLELTVVVGGSNPHLAGLEQLVEHADRSIRLLKDVSDMPALMVWADLAVAGAGTTSWEMCMMGLPAALCVLAPNQEKIASELARLGSAVDLGYTNRVPVARTEATLRDLLIPAAQPWRVQPAKLSWARNRARARLCRRADLQQRSIRLPGFLGWPRSRDTRRSLREPYHGSAHGGFCACGSVLYTAAFRARRLRVIALSNDGHVRHSLYRLERSFGRWGGSCFSGDEDCSRPQACRRSTIRQAFERASFACSREQAFAWESDRSR
jgi:hypothetical protein